MTQTVDLSKTKHIVTHIQKKVKLMLFGLFLRKVCYVLRASAVRTRVGCIVDRRVEC